MTKKQCMRLALVVCITGVLFTSALPIYSFLSGPQSRVNDEATILIVLLSGIAAFISWIFTLCVLGVVGLIVYMIYDYIKNGPNQSPSRGMGPG